MSRPVVAAVLLLLALAGLVAAEGLGRLQVTCRPGVRVYLDGEFVGLTTADEDGLFLREVAAGDHVVRVEKLGFEPVDFEVEVRASRATELRVGELMPIQVGVAPTPAPPHPAEPPAPSPTATPVPIPSEPAAAEPMVAALPSPASPASPPAAAAPDLRMPTAATVAPPPAAVVVAPLVATAPAERAPEPTPPATPTPTPPATPMPTLPATPMPTLPATPTPTPNPVAAVPTVMLSGSAKLASDVAFAYRASGPAAAEGWSIAIWRERGGPSAPVLVLTCSASAPCEQQTSPRFAPGAYRFRVVFSRTQGEGGKATVLFRHEVAVEIETRSDTAYLVEAMYGGDDPSRCNATVREARFVPGED